MCVLGLRRDGPMAGIQMTILRTRKTVERGGGGDFGSDFLGLILDLL